MMTTSEILPFGRFKYPQSFSGSFKGMRYKIVHPKPGEGEENLFYVETWPEPYCYEKTNPEEIYKTTFEYSKDGYDQIIPFLNEMHAKMTRNNE